MHESGMIRGLVERIEEVVRNRGGGRVSKVKVSIGVLANISASHFQEHYDIETVGTVAEGAKLELEESVDFTHPQAGYILLKSIEVEEKS